MTRVSQLLRQEKTAPYIWLTTPGHHPCISVSIRALTAFLKSTSPVANLAWKHKIPSAYEALEFEVQIHLSWRVIDPISVVQNRLIRPETVIRPAIFKRLREILRQFSPDEPREAEKATNNFIDRQPPDFVDRALYIDSSAVFVSLNEITKARMVELYEQDQESRVIRQRVARIEDYVDNDSGLLAYHLAVNPRDTSSAIQAIIDSNKSRAGSATEILQLLIEKGLVNHEDINNDASSSGTPLQGLFANLDGPPFNGGEPRQLDSSRQETIEDQLRNIGRTDPEPESRISASMYTSSSDGSTIKTSLLNLLGRFDLVLDSEEPVLKGSWFQKIWLKARESASSEPVSERIKKLESALELHTLGKVRAEVDKAKAEAVGILLSAVSTQESAVVRIGSLVIVKDHEQVAIWTISEVEAAELERNSTLVRNPVEVINHLQHLKAATRIDREHSLDAVTTPRD